MGDGSEESKRSSTTGMQNLSLETNRFSRDFLQMLVGSSGSRQNEFKTFKREEEGEDEEEDTELSLGLSLGGRFGVDKSRSNKLVRSSSIAACLPIVKDDDAVAPPLANVGPTLARTSSLPVETEEEWRKRKELQTLRRMEAKRRRSEKQRNLRAEKEAGGGSREGGGGGEGRGRGVGGGGFGGEDERKEIEVNWRGRLEMLTAKRISSSLTAPFGLNALPASSRQASIGRCIERTMSKGKASYASASSGGHGQPLSQGSAESQLGSSSTVSEMESKALQGCSSSSDLSPVSMQSLHEATNQETGTSGGRTMRTPGADTESPSKRTDASGNQPKEVGSNAVEDMPCVFTKGDGPCGRRVDGILYKYGKSEEVRIMCVCHGSFLSPAEFVRHAGGTDVTHPLKHIVINPNPPSF